ncbi:MAG TPA: hypothetical protein VGJ82_07240 [Thermoanaerobaculia bacterium]|jgi:hypothetical protein
MAELPQPIADHLDEIRELCITNHVLRLSFVDDPSSPVPNFMAEFEKHLDALTRGRRFHAVWGGLFDFVGDNNLTTPAMVEDDWNPFRTVSPPQLDIYAYSVSPW